MGLVSLPYSPSFLLPFVDAFKCRRNDRYKATDEVLIVQNAGAKSAGTGLNKSAVVEKISLLEAAAVQKGEKHEAQVTVVNSTVQVVNPNGEFYTAADV